MYDYFKNFDNIFLQIKNRGKNEINNDIPTFLY